MFFQNRFPKKSRPIFSLTRIFQNNIPEFSVILEQRSGNFRFMKKIISEIVSEFRIFGTFSIMEMEKIFCIISVYKS